ncbi:MAG: FRG domain-containing protein [Anaerolineales bacterium]|nr:FRG domain-containing protein [Anaerolineales bacterium]
MPSLLRYSNGPAYENDLYEDFVTRGGFLIDRSKSSWELLAEMRHYGIPTRLLDWTTSLAVAIYFAIVGDAPNPCIWVLNPFRLTHAASGEKAIINFDIQGEYDFVRDFVRTETGPFELPLAMACPWRNARMQAQQGYYTIHGNDIRPLEVITPRYVKKVDLPKSAILDAGLFLEQAGIDEYKLFPDLDGLARWLRTKYELG